MLVAESCLTLCSPTDCSPPGASVHGILQVRILEGVFIPFSRGSSQYRDWTQVSCIAGRFFAIWTTRGVLAANKGPIRWTEPSLVELLELCVATGPVIVPDWSLSRLCGWWSHVNQLTSPERLPVAPPDHVSLGSLKELNQHVGNSRSPFPSSVFTMCCTHTPVEPETTCRVPVGHVRPKHMSCLGYVDLQICTWMPVDEVCALPFVVIPTPLHIHMTCLVPVGTGVVASGRWLQRLSGHICHPGAPHGSLPLAAAVSCPQGGTGSCCFLQNFPCFHELLQNEKEKERERALADTPTDHRYLQSLHHRLLHCRTLLLITPSPLLVTSKHHLPPQLSSHLVFCCFFLSYLSYQVFCDRSLWAEPISWLFSFYPSNHDSQRTVGLGQWLRIAVSVSWALRAAFYSQSVLFLFSPRFQVRRDSRSLRDLKNVASAEVWLVSENNSLWR